MYSLVTSKNVSWPRLIWPTHTYGPTTAKERTSTKTAISKKLQCCFTKFHQIVSQDLSVFIFKNIILLIHVGRHGKPLRQKVGLRFFCK